MAKNSSKRKGFREYYYEEDDQRPKRKRIDESHKDEMRFKEKIRRIDPKKLSDEDFDDDYYNVG